MEELKKGLRAQGSAVSEEELATLVRSSQQRQCLNSDFRRQARRELPLPPLHIGGVARQTFGHAIVTPESCCPPLRICHLAWPQANL